MMKILKVIGIAVGAAIGLAALSIGFLIIYWAISSARVEKDALISQVHSPDGHFAGELHRFTTGIHGGPDTIYVAIRQVREPFGRQVYSRTYECDDLSAFRLEWEQQNELTIFYGGCNAGVATAYDWEVENKVWKREDSYRDVKIAYVDTKHVALR